MALIWGTPRPTTQHNNVLQRQPLLTKALVGNLEKLERYKLQPRPAMHCSMQQHYELKPKARSAMCKPNKLNHHLYSVLQNFIEPFLNTFIITCITPVWQISEWSISNSIFCLSSAVYKSKNKINKRISGHLATKPSHHQEQYILMLIERTSL